MADCDQQLTDDLPAIRITLNAWIEIKDIEVALYTTILKEYVCMFVYMVAKTVHLGLISDLSTEAVLAIFKRFTKKRRLYLKV